MSTAIELFLKLTGSFFLIYLLIYSTFLLLSLIVGGLVLWKKDKLGEIRNELKHDFYYPISLLVPAYNEEVNIIDNIHSLLNLDYKLYEIVVVDDGSKDRTSEVLIEHFQMERTDRPIRRVVPCKQSRAVYEKTVNGVHMTLIVKENGRKGDALNMGINASQYPWFVCIDADSLLQKDSLERIVQPVLEDDSIVAVGGMIFVSQVLKMENGMPVRYDMPLNPVVAMQVMEYGRSFLASRILMDTFNGNLIISGAFGLFRKDIVMAVGGYDTDTLGEDMELVVKMHAFCRNANMKYSIRFEPAAVCWSQVPETLGDLFKQRRRWHLGLFQSLYKYRQMFLNSRYGAVSFISYLYYVFYELISPYLEILGLVLMFFAWCVGMLNGAFAIRFLCLYGVYGACLSMAAFYQRIYMQKMKIHFKDGVMAIIACLCESLLFRYYIAFARGAAFRSYRKRKDQWGSIQRMQHKTDANQPK